MSGIEEPLFYHEDGPAPAESKQDNSSLSATWQRGVCSQYLPVLLCVALIVPFILFLLWGFAFLEPSLEDPVVIGSSSSAPGEFGSVPAVVRDLSFLLHPENHVSRNARVSHLSWNITKETIAPDGVEKQVILINGQFPGPTIEARSGDILEIKVVNLLDEGVSLHWHGLHMRVTKEANHMDGPVGFTQCAIPPGGLFTYRVPIDDQAGTFWYHAHSEVHRGDGLYGGLVIHNPHTAENITYQYDSELLFLVGDWYHWSSKTVLDHFMSQTSVGTEPCPDSLLINGLGYFECSMATPGAPVNCSEIERPMISLNKHMSYRVRLVNVGSLSGLSFTVPDSEINVIQVDGGQPVISYPANSVGVLYPAERVDFVVTWPRSTADADSEIIVQLDNEYFLRPNFALTPTQSFLLHSNSLTRQPPIHTDARVAQFSLQNATGPVLSSPLPAPEKIFMIYAVVEVLAHQNSIPKGFINHTTWEPPNLPLIATERESWNQHQLVPWTGPGPLWVELTINNIDTQGHPFHLHGFDFYVVASYEGNGGWDYFNPFDSTKPPRGGPFNVLNPLRKDTVYVHPFGYVVLRFLADSEGIWALHCHVLWHQGSGMVMAFQVLGHENAGLSKSSMGLAAKAFCEAGK